MQRSNQLRLKEIVAEEGITETLRVLAVHAHELGMDRAFKKLNRTYEELTATRKR